MKRPVLVYMVLTFALTWLCWAIGAGVLHRGGADAAGLRAIAQAVFLLGTIAPSLVALSLTAKNEGREAAGALVGRVFKGNVGLRWYVCALAFMPAIKLSAAVVHRVVSGAWPRFGSEPWYGMAAAIAISMWVQAGEEIGWRGYALPRMSARIGLAPASVILGVIWAVWHVPLFFVNASDTYGQSFPLFVAEVVPMSVALAWLYWRTGGSLMLVMLLHAAVNNTKDIVPSVMPGATNALTLSTSLVAWITVALLWIAAALFLVQMRSRRAAVPL